MPPYIFPYILANEVSAVINRTETSTLLLLGDADGPAAPAGGLGVLAAHADAPVVAEAAVRADLLQALEVLAQLDVLLPVEEPVGDLVLARVLHDGDDLLDLLLAELAGALRQVDVGLLQHDVGVAAPDALDGRHGEHDVPLAVDVGVHHTEDVLEVLRDHQ